MNRPSRTRLREAEARALRPSPSHADCRVVTPEGTPPPVRGARALRADAPRNGGLSRRSPRPRKHFCSGPLTSSGRSIHRTSTPAHPLAITPRLQGGGRDGKAWTRTQENRDSRRGVVPGWPGNQPRAGSPAAGRRPDAALPDPVSELGAGTPTQAPAVPLPSAYASRSRSTAAPSASPGPPIGRPRARWASRSPRSATIVPPPGGCVSPVCGRCRCTGCRRLLRARARAGGWSSPPAATRSYATGGCWPILLMSEQPEICAKETTTADNQLFALARALGADGGALPRGDGRPKDPSSRSSRSITRPASSAIGARAAATKIQHNDVIGRSGKGYGVRIVLPPGRAHGRELLCLLRRVYGGVPDRGARQQAHQRPPSAAPEPHPGRLGVPLLRCRLSLTYHVDEELNRIAYVDGASEPGEPGAAVREGPLWLRLRPAPRSERYGPRHPPRGVLPQAASLALRSRRAPAGAEEGISAGARDEARLARLPRGLLGRGAGSGGAQALGGEGCARALGPLGFGSAKCSIEEAYLFQKLVRAVFGTNNVDDCTRLCHASSVAAPLQTIGLAWSPTPSPASPTATWPSSPGPTPPPITRWRPRSSSRPRRAGPSSSSFTCAAPTWPVTPTVTPRSGAAPTWPFTTP